MPCAVPSMLYELPDLCPCADPPLVRTCIRTPSTTPKSIFTTLKFSSDVTSAVYSLSGPTLMVRMPVVSSVHCTGPFAVSTLSPTITLGADATAVVLVVVVDVLLDVGGVVVSVVVVVVVVVVSVVVAVVVVVVLDSVEAVVVVEVLLEVEAAVADDTGVSEGICGGGIDCVHEIVMPAAETTATTNIDRLLARLGSGIRPPPVAPGNTPASARLSVTASAQDAETFDTRPNVQSITANSIAKRIGLTRAIPQTTDTRNLASEQSRYPEGVVRALKVGSRTVPCRQLQSRTSHAEPKMGNFSPCFRLCPRIIITRWDTATVPQRLAPAHGRMPGTCQHRIDRRCPGYCDAANILLAVNALSAMTRLMHTNNQPSGATHGVEEFARASPGSPRSER